MAATVNLQDRKAHIAFIPKDIMANIFKRLPVRSLIRLQSVSKDWKNLIKCLINTPSFIEDHLQHSTYRNPFLLLEQYHRKFCGIRLSVLDCDMRVGKVQKLPSTSIDSLYNFEVLGSSNGLVCVKIENGTNPHPILIWNPATRDIMEVRPRTAVHSHLIHHYGFGFSALGNDYKIVRINVFYPFAIKAVEMYSLNSGSWKEINYGNLRGIRTSTTNITVNGVMFWATSDENRILSIDLSKEACKLIPMPYIRSSLRRLVEYENKLALVAPIKEQDGSNLIHLWVLEEEDTCPFEGDRRWEWIKVYTGSCFTCNCLNPVTIWRNEIVLLPSDQTQNDHQMINLYFLNFTTNKFKRFDLKSYSYDFGHIRRERPVSYPKRDIEIAIFNYVESLVLVNGHH
ncbi:putative F-box protein At3g10430 [Neltuma alba]|uniref:putative F-box protein At3g10430 n=1 Tax=Neltuma alba TaxID=207710 RepID=UPI0010A2D492|nr:putative F-box protein At3g10430 [Prosopis alba]